MSMSTLKTCAQARARAVDSGRTSKNGCSVCRLNYEARYRSKHTAEACPGLPMLTDWRHREGRSGLSERAWRLTGPPPEGPVERRGFGILQKERDVADAQAAILKQGAREVTSHLVENMAE